MAAIVRGLKGWAIGEGGKTLLHVRHTLESLVRAELSSPAVQSDPRRCNYREWGGVVDTGGSHPMPYKG